jgi:hypothetical protein
LFMNCLNAEFESDKPAWKWRDKLLRKRARSCKNTTAGLCISQLDIQ